MKRSHLILMVVFNVLWAASLSMVQALKPHLTEGGLVTLRFGLAGAGLLLLWPVLPGAAPRGRDLVRASLMGFIVFMFGHRLQVAGNQLSTAANSAVLMGLEPLLTSIAAAVFLAEHIAWRRWVGFGLGMTGVVLLNGVWRSDFRWSGLGPSLIFISSFLCEAAYSVMGKPLLARAGVLKVLAVGLLVGTAANLAWDGRTTVAAMQRLPLTAWLHLAYLAVVCTMMGYAVWLVVIREVDVNVVAMTIFIQPLAGVPIAWLWLHDTLHWGQLWGCLAIVAGLVVALWRTTAPEDGLRATKAPSALDLPRPLGEPTTAP